MLNSKYGFTVGQNVFAKVDLYDENKGEIKVGDALRIVSIPPKVTYTNPWYIKNEPQYYDNKEYFVNLVRANQKENCRNRIRCHFVCISKRKPLA